MPDRIRTVHPELRAWFFSDPTPRFLNDRKLQLSAQKKDGSSFPMESSLFAIKTEEAPIAVNLLRDITSDQEHQKQITEYAFVDALTNLPNRRYFTENLKRNAAKTKRHDQRLALLFIDLDHFKPINDNEGHEVGDAVLAELAQRLAKALRAEDMLARVGGDEFVIMIYPLPKPALLDEVVTRVLSACRLPVKIKQQVFQLSASIGVSISQGNKFDEQQLLKEADIAMYQAKDKGGDGCVYYDNNDHNSTIKPK